MGHVRGKFSGLALLGALFLFGAGEWMWGLVALGVSGILYGLLGGRAKGFVLFVAMMLIMILCFVATSGTW